MAEFTAMRNNALPYPVYGLPFVVTFPLLDADGDPISPSSQDSEISKNGDTFADCTNEAVEIATTSGICYLSLTGTELTTDVATVQVKSTGAKTTVLSLYPRKLVSIRAGTSASGGVSTSTIVLDGSASAVDDFYNGMIVAAVIDSVTEVRMITDYTGSNQTATVVPDWNTAPDNNDTFTIYRPDGVQIQQSNLTHWLGTAAATPTVAGVPEVDITHWRGTAVPVPDSNGYPVVTIKVGDLQGELDITGGLLAWNPEWSKAIHPYEDVYFVRKDGNDSDDGLSPTNAKLTLAGAKAVADADDLIIVSPGTYNESNLAKNGVDWYLEDGVIIDGQGSAVFDDAGSAISFDIKGRGDLRSTAAGDDAQPVILATHTSTVINVECKNISGDPEEAVITNLGTVNVAADYISSNSANGYALSNAGTAKIKAIRVYTSGGGACLNNTGNLTAHADILETVDGECVGQDGVNSVSYINVGRMICGTGEAVSVVGGRCVVDCPSLTGAAANGIVRFSSTTAGTLILRDSTAINTHATTGALHFESATSNKTVILRNCTLRSTSANSVTDAGATTPTITIDGHLSTSGAIVGTVTVSYQNKFTADLKPTTAGRTLNVSAGGVGDADAVAISTDSTAADRLETMLDGTGGNTLTANIAGSVTGSLSGSVGSVTAIVTANVTQWRSSAVPVPDSNGYPICTIKSGDLSGELDISGGFLAWNPAWDAEVQSEVQDAIEVNHLDHLLAVDYDPTSKPGVATALLNELIESDGGVSQFTANALEEAPSGGGGGGGPADPTWVDDDHTWEFDSRNQTTASNTIAENIGFNALAALEPDLSPRLAILTADDVSVTPATGGAVVAPTLGTPTVQTNKQRCNIPIDATLATAGTFTVSLTFTTTDGQIFVRKGRITFS